MNTKYLRMLGYAIFFLGVSAGFVMTVITIWDGLEATSYFFKGATYEPFRGLRCPVWIAPTEKGIVTAVFKNSTDEEDTFYYRAEISGTPDTRQIEDRIAVASHQAKST